MKMKRVYNIPSRLNNLNAFEVYRTWTNQIVIGLPVFKLENFLRTFCI